jgi:hypothetical protein
MLQVLLPVIVGGLIAIVGGLVGPTFVERTKAKAERERKRREKFEELVLAIYEHRHWISTMRGSKVFGHDDFLAPSPMAKIETISAIYFPVFRDQIHDLDILADKYEFWMMEARRKRLNGDDTYVEGGTEAHRAYSEAALRLLKELRDYAQRVFQ